MGKVKMNTSLKREDSHCWLFNEYYILERALQHFCNSSELLLQYYHRNVLEKNVGFFKVLPDYFYCKHKQWRVKFAAQPLLWPGMNKVPMQLIHELKTCTPAWRLNLHSITMSTEPWVEMKLNTSWTKENQNNRCLFDEVAAGDQNTRINPALVFSSTT